MSNFSGPHGLIKTKYLEEVYRDAYYSDYNGTEPKENATTQLMEDLFNKYLFVEQEFAVNSQVPPTRDSQKACDIVVHYYESERIRKRILCFVECKRRSDQSSRKIRRLEEQAAGYAKDYLDDPDNKDLSFVYVCTAAGAHLRQWKYEREPGRLIGFWAGQQLDDWKQYKDVGNDADGAIIEKNFQFMKNTAPELREGQDYSTYGALLPPKDLPSNPPTNTPAQKQQGVVFAQVEPSYVEATTGDFYIAANTNTQQLPATGPTFVTLSCHNSPNGPYYTYSYRGELVSDWPTSWKPGTTNSGYAFLNLERNVWASVLPKPEV